MTATEIANKALDHLLRYKGQVIATKALFKGCGAADWGSTVSHAEFRSVMNRLYFCGMVTRGGVGTFLWSLKHTEWDRSNPFKKREGAPEPEEKKHTHSPSPSLSYPPIPPLAPTYQPPQQVAPSLSAFNALRDEVNLLTRQLDAQVVKGNELQSKLNTTNDVLDDLRAQKQSYVKELTVKKWDGSVTKLKNKILPKVYDRVFQLASMRRNIMLFGPAGCGKTYLAKLVADSLDLKFGSVSCTAGMSEAHLLGRVVPDMTKGKNVFQGAAFLDCYENGGVFLLDELDAADPNLMLCLNTALANGYCNVPNRRSATTADRHEDFVCIGTANTTGRGANRMYVGRNQLDEATIDRFRIGCVEMDYDPNVESALIPDEGENKFLAPAKSETENFIARLLDKKYGLLSMCRYIRHMIEQSGLRRIMSTRFMEDAAVMMKGADWTLQQVLEVYFEGWSPEEKAKVCQ